jgi:hypothetical protein
VEAIEGAGRAQDALDRGGVEGVDVALEQVHVAPARLARAALGPGEHARGEIDSDQRAALLGIEARGDLVETLAGAAGQIEDQLSRGEIEGLRRTLALLAIQRLEGAIVKTRE